MRSRLMSVVAIAAIVSSPSPSAQRREEAAGSRFAFQPGQRVYVTAFRTIEPSSARHAAALPSDVVMDNHLPAELRMRQEFDKRRVYTLVDKASAADFVFVVVIDGGAAEGLTVAPDLFARYRTPLNVEALREAAFTRSTIGPLTIHTLGRLSDRLVGQFHQEDGRARTTTP